MKLPSPITHIEMLEREDGVVVASCPELGLSAEGATIAEAEAAVMRLIEERTDQLGAAGAPQAVETEMDARLADEE